MTQISAVQLGEDLQTYLNGVLEAQEPLVVTLAEGRGKVVLLSEQDFESWRETIHLLGDPTNAARLMHSIQQADDGRLIDYDPDDVIKLLP